MCTLTSIAHLAKTTIVFRLYETGRLFLVLLSVTVGEGIASPATAPEPCVKVSLHTAPPLYGHLILIPSRSSFRMRSLNTAISASHSSWEYPSGSSLSDFFSCFLGAFFSMIVFVSLACLSSWQCR